MVSKMKESCNLAQQRRRRASVAGVSLVLSLKRHFLFFVLICFSMCCNESRTKSQTSWCGCCGVAALVLSPEEIGDSSQTLEATTQQELAKSKPANQTLNQILIKAGKRGLGGGISGAVAGIVQVVALMWLRTLTNYQCRYGTTFRQALQTLLKEGGIRRLYRGLTFALIQAPMTRFVSTAANDGVESFLSSFKQTQEWGPQLTTIIASLFVGMARILLMPIDTMKTVLQVDSFEGFRNLMRRLKMGKFMVLYEGAAAVAVMGVVGHYPWFATYNLLSKQQWLENLVPYLHCRNALIGFVASLISDTVTNVFRVVKTTKQVTGSKSNSSYEEIIRMIVAADGWKGLFGRGLRTRLASNAVQSVLFTVVWRGVAEWSKNRNSSVVEDTQS